MKRNLDLILNILLSCTCLSASFSFIRHVNEWQTIGKWIGMLVFLFLYIVLLFLTVRQDKVKPACKKNIVAIVMFLMNFGVTAVCLLELSEWQRRCVLPSFRHFTVYFSFMNSRKTLSRWRKQHGILWISPSK